MDRERWKEIDAVFERILDVEPEERANALAQMSAGDDDLRRRVEALLNQEEAAEDFLKSSAIAGLAGQVVEGLGSLAPGARISHYRIESRIGAGGMGEVWKARDEHLDRAVAIKVLPPEFSDDPEWVRHFEQEAHMVSALNHPNNFSADSKTLVTPANDLRMNIWEVGSWKKLREIYTGGYGQFLLSPDGRWRMAPHGEVYDLINGQGIPDTRPPFFSGITPNSENARPPFWSWAALSPDGKRIISIDSGGFVAFSETSMFQNPQARKLKRIDRAHRGHGRAVVYSPTGRLAASGAEDIVLWDAIGQKKLARFKHPANVMSLAFAPDGRWLVSAHADGAILTWDTEERELAADFREHSASVEAVAFAPDGNRVASAGEDGSVIVWDTERRLKEAVLLWHPITITAVAFSADGRLLASNDLDGNLAMWEVAGWRQRWALKAAKRITSEASYCVAISPDARWVATSYGIYESGEGRLVNDFRTEFDAPGAPRPTEIRDVAFSADGRWLVSVTARGDLSLRQSGQWQVVDSRKLDGKHLVSVSLSPDGKRLVTGEDEGLARLWSVEPLAEIAVIGKHDARIKSVAFSPDGRTVASAGDDKTISLWDVDRRELITSIGGRTTPVLAVSFSTDGKRLVSGWHDRSARLHTRRKTLWGWRWD